MKPPLMLRLAPESLKIPLYYCFYRSQRQKFAGLFESASLLFAPQAKMKLVPTDEGHANIAFTGYYELDLTKRIVQHAKSGGLLVDVGANYGYYSLLWAAMRNSNHVVAFEASPRNYLGIKQNIAMNQMQAQIELHALAAGNKEGKLEFAIGPEEQTGWGGFSLDKTKDTTEVNVIRLDKFWQRSEDIDVLKIDVEGADTWVLQGAEELLGAKRIKQIYYEQNKGRMRLLNISEDKHKNFLTGLGYQVTPLNDVSSGLVEYSACPRP